METLPLDLPNDTQALTEEGMVLAVDKPLGMTSFKVVAILRSAFRKRYQLKRVKIGHAGTLDPLATGVLVVCVGRATKRIHTFMDSAKAYRAEMTLGAVTASYDAETEVEPTGIASPDCTEALKQEILAKFQGEIDQVPPIYSAVRSEGQRAYELARAGEEVHLKSRRVTIHQLDIHCVAPDRWVLDIACSKGTYIRSLAHDIGQHLGCGAYLSGLVRTQVGDYRLEDCHELESLAQRVRAK